MGQHTTLNAAANAADDFREARRRASMEELMARLTGRSTQLLSFEDVRQKLKVTGESSRGRQEIPLDAIVGSVGRYSDFTRTFLPRQDSDEQRWTDVKNAMTQSGNSLPPIEVYQIGEVYFVVDGNHRVSVAQRQGMEHISAYVTEYQTKVLLGPDDKPDDLIIKAEYADFLERTRVDEIRPDANLQVTVPGRYWEIETQIEAHRFLLGQENGGDVSHEEAVDYWHDNIYLPVIEHIREQGMLRDFPDRTETDLFLWICEHRSALEKQLGWHVEAEVAATDLVTSQSQRPQRIVSRVEDKLFHTLTPGQLAAGPAAGQWREQRLATRRGDCLFADILVPVSGDECGWFAMEQALFIAKQEGSQLFGLHIVSSPDQIEGEAAQAVKAEFLQRCQMADIPGELSIEAGDIVGKICERAPWSDLIVMYPATPPGAKLWSRLTSGSRTVIYRSARPVLTVPGPASSMERILLAYDGSPKAQEGLFVAAYLAGYWSISLDVLTVTERVNHRGKLEEAQHYLESRDIEANYITTQGDVVEVILATAAEHKSDLIIMGGYGARPLREVVLGANLDRLLRESLYPILVCR